MDTRFWGPSGWKLGHTIAYTYPLNPSLEDKHNYSNFFFLWQHILPCKYCRRSFRQYQRELPIEPFLESREKMAQWMYKMHNKVNAKLRKQGLLKEANPSFKSVNQKYKKLVQEKCQDTLLGWDFIYSIAFNYSEDNNFTVSKAFYYYQFFYYLGKVIPCMKYRQLYKKYFTRKELTKALISKDNLIKWLYQIHCQINHNFKKDNKDYEQLCHKYESFRSGCSKKTYKGKTCRSKTKSKSGKSKKTKRKLKRYIS